MSKSSNEKIMVMNKEHNVPDTSQQADENIEEEPAKKTCGDDCACAEKERVGKISLEELDRLLNERERQLRAEFQEDKENGIFLLKDRFDFILQNEQIRTSHMLREAHRERQEKIGALRKQLECKNLAAIMYVLCSERRKSRLERMRIIEEYTTIIRGLQDILTEGQSLIVNLSKGYKTAAKVDAEWKEKMTKVVKEFQNFVNHYVGGAPESNQFVFDLPAMLKTKSPLENPQDDPWEEEMEEFGEEQFGERSDSEDGDKTWWEQLEDDCKPFIMFGDMADFKPPQRRAVLKVVKAAKTAPKEWKSYVFHEMFLKTDCSHNDLIKNEYQKHHPTPKTMECRGVAVMLNYVPL